MIEVCSNSQLDGFVEERTVEGEGLVLATLSAHVDAVARFLEKGNSKKINPDTMKESCFLSIYFNEMKNVLNFCESYIDSYLIT